MGINQEIFQDAARYRKLQKWMTSNVQEGWHEVECMGSLGANVNAECMDEYLDDLPECNVGLWGYNE